MASPDCDEPLYTPAGSAERANSADKAIYDRLVRAGRSRMVAIRAVTRKLLMIAYGVLKPQKVFSFDLTR